MERLSKNMTGTKAYGRAGKPVACTLTPATTGALSAARFGQEIQRRSSKHLPLTAKGGSQTNTLTKTHSCDSGSKTHWQRASRAKWLTLKKEHEDAIVKAIERSRQASLPAR
jgi:hypothetical protein